MTVPIKEIQRFIKLCLPLAAAFLAQKGMQFIDTLMMGWIGPTGLAAGALATNIFITILVFCRGVLSTVGVSIVHARGAGQEHEIQSFLYQAIYLALAMSVPAMLLAWQAPYYLVALGQNPVVVASAERLLQGLTWGIPGFMLFYVLREFIAAFALARAVMVVCFMSIPLTFAGNYVLIYGKYGFPALGIAGIGYASAGVCWFMFVALLLYCHHQAILKKYIAWHWCKPDWQKLKSLWITGAPAGIIMVLDMITFLAAALMAGYFGIIPLAAFQIALQCASTAFNLPLAISIVTALEVGHAYSAKNLPRAIRFIYIGITTGLIISALIACVLIWAPHAVMHLFLPHNTDAKFFSVVRLFLIAAGLILCFDGAQAIIIGALRGLKDTFIPMLISIICYLMIGLTSAYLFAFHTSLGATGVWYGLFLAIFSLCIVTGLRLHMKLDMACKTINTPSRTSFY